MPIDGDSALVIGMIYERPILFNFPTLVIDLNFVLS